jgi:hypothetical protein
MSWGPCTSNTVVELRLIGTGQAYSAAVDACADRAGYPTKHEECSAGTLRVLYVNVLFRAA